jgi:hypothetical protein
MTWLDDHDAVDLLRNARSISETAATPVLVQACTEGVGSIARLNMAREPKTGVVQTSLGLLPEDFFVVEGLPEDVTPKANAGLSDDATPKAKLGCS